MTKMKNIRIEEYENEKYKAYGDDDNDNNDNNENVDHSNHDNDDHHLDRESEYREFDDNNHF